MAGARKSPHSSAVPAAEPAAAVEIAWKASGAAHSLARSKLALRDQAMNGVIVLGDNLAGAGGRDCKAGLGNITHSLTQSKCTIL